MSLRGSVCLYQGEELGLDEADIEFADIRDPYGVEFWPEFKGRDGCRTPMVWSDSNNNFGFSNGLRTWLPIPAEHGRLSVKIAEADPKALIHHYRQAIELRNMHIALAKGELLDMQVDNNLLTFVRKSKNQTVFCAFNLGDEIVSLNLPDGDWKPVMQDVNSAVIQKDNNVVLEPWQPCLAVKHPL